MTTRDFSVRRARYLLYTETFPSRDPRSPRQTGIGRYCYDLAAGLADLGQEVVVLTNTGLGPAVQPTTEPFRVVAKGGEPRSLLAKVRRGSLVTRALDEHRPDILLFGDPQAHQVCSWLGPRLRAPYCPILYGSELLSLTQTGQSAGGSPLRRAARLLMRRYFRRAAETVCISRYTARLLASFTPGVQANCIVYPSVSELVLRRPPDPAFGVRLRSSLAINGTPPVILLTIGRISQRKNQLGVLQAMAQVHQTGPTRLHYLIVGNVDAGAHEGYRRQLQSFIAESGLERSVTFISNASDDEKVAYLDTCDILVMLSRTVGASVEGFGISAIEASCRGKPVLVGDQGGMPETIVEGRTGFAVPAEDISRVASALGALAASERLRNEMGQAGRTYCRSEFTPEINARRLHEHLLRKGLLGPSDR
jgi:phosphatidyl-myo-inositol dimannoside synthase